MVAVTIPIESDITKTLARNILRDTRALLQDESKFVARHSAVDKNGMPSHPQYEHATRFSLNGALVRAAANNIIDPAYETRRTFRLVNRLLEAGLVTVWNKPTPPAFFTWAQSPNRTYDEVASVLDVSLTLA